jgi:hypothetical protein
VCDAAGELAERFHFLRTHELVLELFPGGDVHEGANPLHRPAKPIANNAGALEQIEMRPVHVPEAVFAGPMLGVRGERIADAGGGAGAILGVKLFLPETDLVRGGRIRVAEERFEALGPGMGAGGYSPNPNSIIRSLGSERKMLRDFIRAARRVRRSFMGLVGSFRCSPVLVLLGCRVSLNFGR